ncbi:signal peptidase I [Bacillus sp. FJAT-42376]|uniref:signal peptidase I n=1 Tax=Bacillus sp. FJAT-42376 TaxID=2014076 RepID=UPI000F5170A9|nr:signal peptidase I [Bacillus sp. FJAT-42376]AZB42111.1 signal peptidase I [Bacillus sp. FJAT-42376]
MKERKKKEIWSWLSSILAAVIVAMICQQFIFTPVMVKGKSMMPTFESDNQIIVSKISRIERFDMIVFHSPISKDNYIKRVIGLPGDTVQIKNDVLTINGKIYKEPYLEQNKSILVPRENLTENLTIRVPAGSYYVMGDNRRDSMDSRVFGCISKKSVIGEAKFRFSPIERMGTLN